MATLSNPDGNVIDDFLDGKRIETDPKGSLMASTPLHPAMKTVQAYDGDDPEIDEIVETVMFPCSEVSTPENAVYAPLPGFSSDSVESTVIRDSLVFDTNYSEKIIQKANEAFKPDAVIVKLKGGHTEEGFQEGERQIRILLDCSDQITKRTAKYCVLLAYRIGELLLFIEQEAGKEKTRKWIDETFQHDHARYFQQARQIASMGDFAVKLSALGKNRLLEFDRLREKPKGKEKKEKLEEIRKMNMGEYDRILTENSLPWTTQFQEEEVHRIHIDAVITYKRLLEAGIVEAEFEQAVLIAAYRRSPLEKKLAEVIKKKMEGVPNRTELFEQYVMNMGIFPNDPGKNTRGESLRGILSRLLKYASNASNEPSLADSFAMQDDRDMIRRAREYLQRMEQSWDEESLN
jgi:hypothetical protein